ncbi:hypothetical protein FOL47_002022 [Perkinsus chesapeaki]|uniref:Uncharacterized protein n=1 Tax=Perkinsus chesapeaki TaxID=330153 RepID=A0A7J6MG10_PERCH|nr:hypothetical protein FOL47_002022 [Perkinsus chesapeaki]
MEESFLYTKDLLQPKILIAVAAVTLTAAWWTWRNYNEKKCPPGMESPKGRFTVSLPDINLDEAHRDFFRAAKSGNVLVAAKGCLKYPPCIPSDVTEEDWRRIAETLLKLCNPPEVSDEVVSRLPQLVNTTLGIEFTKQLGLPPALLQPKYVIVAEGSKVRVALYAYLAGNKGTGFGYVIGEGLELDRIRC